MEISSELQEAVEREIKRLKLIIACDKNLYREEREKGVPISELVSLCSEIVEYQNELYLLQMGRLKELPYHYQVLLSK